MKKLSRFLGVILLLMLLPSLVLCTRAASCKCGGTLVRSAVDDVQPGCTEPGFLGYVCDSCGTAYPVEVPALGHTYIKQVMKAPTCYSEGLALYRCTRCGDSYEDKLAEVGHYFAAERTEGSCTEDEKTVYTCVFCYESYEETVKAPGHDFRVTNDSEPTCTEYGIHREVCSRCGEVLLSETPALGHSFTETVTEATCTKTGVRTQICARCGETEVELIPPAGHHFSDWVTEKKPTPFSPGSVSRTCLQCGEKEIMGLESEGFSGMSLLIPGILLLLGGLTAGVILLLRPRRTGAHLSRSGKTSAAGLPALKKSSILLCLDNTPENRELEALLRSRRYLDVRKPGGNVAEAEKPPEKTLVIFSARSYDNLAARISELKKLYDGAEVGAVAQEDVREDVLRALKEQKLLLSYARSTDSAERKLLRLVLPLYKPQKITGSYAENAALLTEAMGFPALTALLNMNAAGGDAADAVRKHVDMEPADLAEMVNDVAGIFGPDRLTNAAESVRAGAERRERVYDKRSIRRGTADE